MQLRQERMNERVRRYVLHHGLANTLFHLAYRVTNSAVMVLIYKVVVLAEAHMDWNLLGADRAGQWGFLSYNALRRFARSDPSLQLDDAFLSEALARGDRCYGFVEDGTLGAYAWYSNSPTPIQDALVADFDPGYVYMHKAFTLPTFRGRQLYGIGVTRAMQALMQEGKYKGLISCVQLHNQPSLKALQRMGFKTVGRVVVLGGRRPYISYSDSGCRSVFRAEVRSGQS
jgi:hypothetical protein